MRRRILCPFHEERTPSLIIYEHSFVCFGCGRRGKLSDLGLTDTAEYRSPPPENLDKSASYILSLPQKLLRGLWLPSDDTGYYIVFPGTKYYKKRLYKGKVKYLSPEGHSKPLFVARDIGQTLIIVEGEINAISIARVCPDYAVCSPGGTGHFKRESYLNFYLKFDNILIVCDKDVPGAVACGELWGLLKARGKEARTLLMDRDANDLLVQDGEEAVKEVFRRCLENSI